MSLECTQAGRQSLADWILSQSLKDGRTSSEFGKAEKPTSCPGVTSEGLYFLSLLPPLPLWMVTRGLIPWGWVQFSQSSQRLPLTCMWMSGEAMSSSRMCKLPLLFGHLSGKGVGVTFIPETWGCVVGGSRQTKSQPLVAGWPHGVGDPLGRAGTV